MAVAEEEADCIQQVEVDRQSLALEETLALAEGGRVAEVDRLGYYNLDMVVAAVCHSS